MSRPAQDPRVHLNPSLVGGMTYVYQATKEIFYDFFFTLQYFCILKSKRVPTNVCLTVTELQTDNLYFFIFNKLINIYVWS